MAGKARERRWTAWLLAAGAALGCDATGHLGPTGSGGQGGTDPYMTTSCNDADNPTSCTFWMCTQVPSQFAKKVHCTAPQPTGGPPHSPGDYTCPPMGGGVYCPGGHLGGGSGPWMCTATESGLECTQGGSNGGDGTPLTPGHCGDGVRNVGEQCDDGPRNGIGDCQLDCTIKPPPMCVLGYPFSSSNPKTNIKFNEQEILTGFRPNVAGPDDTLKVFYVDEHALTLGKGSVSAMNADPGNVGNPNIGDPGAKDNEGRPIFPALFVTDITTDPNSKAGDWQYGGMPLPPHAVLGTWKAQGANDPAPNHLTIGNGDMSPAGMNSGDDTSYSAEVQWTVSMLQLIPGHTYRVQFMFHDGDDQSDVGQGCAIVRAAPSVN